jgi:hypothetical protein
MLQLVKCYDVYMGMSVTTPWRNSDGERTVRSNLLKKKLPTWRPSWTQPVSHYHVIAQNATPTIDMTPFEMSNIIGFYAVRLLTINHTPTIILSNFTVPHDVHMANNFWVKCGILTAMTTRITILWHATFCSSLILHINEARVGANEITTLQNLWARFDRTGSTGVLRFKINPVSNYCPCGFTSFCR